MKVETVAVFEDNSGANHLANKNPMGLAKSRHIDICHRSIRDVVKRGESLIVHVQSKSQHADLFTQRLVILV